MNTPFENVEAGWTRIFNISMTMSAAEEMVKLSNDCALQIAVYKELLQNGTKAERDAEKGITAQAMRDTRRANEAIVALADALEVKYGISA